jgi:hypothetical protein
MSGIMPELPPRLQKYQAPPRATFRFARDLALRPWRNRRLRQLTWLSLSAFGIFILAAQMSFAHLPDIFGPTVSLVAGDHPFGYDAWSYYNAHAGANAYVGTATTAGLGPWRYAPLWLPLLAPLQALSFPAFAYVMTAIEAASLLYLTRRWFFASFLFVPVFIELYEGNIYLLSAALIVFALRHSGGRRPTGAAAYAVLAFTKVSPFAVTAYYVFRREWRPLIVACGAVATLSAVGYLADPTTWNAWINSVNNTAAAPDNSPLGLSLEMRGYLVLLVLLLAAWRRWPALVLVAAFLALPAIWWHSYSMLIAIPAAAASLSPERNSTQSKPEVVLGSMSPARSP